jgi:hypothetical protein
MRGLGHTLGTFAVVVALATSSVGHAQWRGDGARPTRRSPERIGADLTLWLGVTALFGGVSGVLVGYTSEHPLFCLGGGGACGRDATPTIVGSTIVAGVGLVATITGLVLVDRTPARVPVAARAALAVVPLEGGALLIVVGAL